MAGCPTLPMLTGVGVPIVAVPRLVFTTGVNKNVSVPVNGPCGPTVMVYVPVTGNVNVLPVALASAVDNVVTTAPLGSRIVRSTPAMLFANTDNVACSPAVASKLRTATSPGVGIVTVVANENVVVPVLSGTGITMNVTVPTSWPRGAMLTV